MRSFVVNQIILKHRRASAERPGSTGRDSPYRGAGRSFQCIKVLVLLLGILYGGSGIAFAQGGSALPGGKPKVVATFTIVYDMARNLAANRLQVQTFMPIGADPHQYDPIPGDAEMVANADLILTNGLHFEGWLDELIATAGGNARKVRVTRGITPLESPDFENAEDPHAWTDPLNGLIYARNIRDAFIALDPAGEAEFNAAYEAYAAEIKATHRYIDSLIAQIPEEKRVLITSHDAFRYFANRYGLQVANLQGTSTESEVQMQDFQQVLEVIQEYGVPCVFTESTINPKMMKQLAKDTKVILGGGLFSDSLGDEDSPAATYISMLRHNARVIHDGITRALAVNTGRQPADTEFSNVAVVAILLGFFGLVFVGLARVLKPKSPRKSSPAGAAAPEISAEGVTVAYDRQVALEDATLNFAGGKVYGILGMNGSGKSTLIKALLGLVPLQSGKVRCNGEPVSRYGKQIAYVPQREEIDWQFPATVKDVVLMGRYPRKSVFASLNKEDHQKARDALEVMGISELAGKQIGELSGGQQQRTFLARALCQEADLFVLDEPFVGIDGATEERITQLLKNLAEQGKLVIVIHHDLSKVEALFDEVVLLRGKVIAAGPLQQAFTPDYLAKTYPGFQLAQQYAVGRD